MQTTEQSTDLDNPNGRTRAAQYLGREAPQSFKPVKPTLDSSPSNSLVGACQDFPELKKALDAHNDSLALVLLWDLRKGTLDLEERKLPWSPDREALFKTLHDKQRLELISAQYDLLNLWKDQPGRLGEPLPPELIKKITDQEDPGQRFVIAALGRFAAASPKFRKILDALAKWDVQFRSFPTDEIASFVPNAVACVQMRHPTKETPLENRRSESENERYQWVAGQTVLLNPLRIDTWQTPTAAAEVIFNEVMNVLPELAMVRKANLAYPVSMTRYIITTAGPVINEELNGFVGGSAIGLHGQKITTQCLEDRMKQVAEQSIKKHLPSYDLSKSSALEHALVYMGVVYGITPLTPLTPADTERSVAAEKALKAMTTKHEYHLIKESKEKILALLPKVREIFIRHDGSLESRDCPDLKGFQEELQELLASREASKKRKV